MLFKILNPVSGGEQTVQQQLDAVASSATDGDIIEVIAGRDSALFEWFGTRYGVAINEWIPLEVSLRITGIMASGNAHYNYETDDLADLASRGWTNSAGVVDDAGGIIITSSSGANRYLRTAITADTKCFALARITPRTINASSNENMPAPYFNTASKVHRFVIGKSGDMTISGVADNTTFQTVGGMKKVGDNPFHGYVDSEKVELSTIFTDPAYNRKVGINENAQSGTFSANTVGVVTQTQTGNESSIQKLIFFTLS